MAAKEGIRRAAEEEIRRAAEEEIRREEALLLAPPERLFSPLTMFVCTWEVVLAGIGIRHEELIKRLEPRGAVVALNCNFGHKCLPGYESFLKTAPRRRKARPRGGLLPATTRDRKPEGDGTCFNSAIEIIIKPDPARPPAAPPMPEPVRALLRAQKTAKYYNVKAFPTTGQSQVAGVLLPGHEDGAYVAQVLAGYLTDSGVGTGPGGAVTVAREGPIMKNYKFHLVRRSSRIIFDLHALVEYLNQVHAAAYLKGRLGEGAARPHEVGGRKFRAMLALQARGAEPEPGLASGEEWALFRRWWAESGEYRREHLSLGGEEIQALLPPFPIREIKPLQDNQNISFKFRTWERAKAKDIRVNIFHRGKINFLGGLSHAKAQAIYEYLAALLRRKWGAFVRIRPLTDRQRAAALARRRRRPPPRPAGLSDAELEALLDDLFPSAPPAGNPAAPPAGNPAAPPAGNPAAPPLDVEEIMALAAEFGGTLGAWP